MKKLFVLGFWVSLCLFSLLILAQVPQLLNYQGMLTDDAGTPITTATTLRFSLYQGGDAATPGSGTLCYQEDASVTPDGNGVFSHLIGSGTLIFGSLDGTVFQTAEPVYLEIIIDPAGANETLLPRKQIVTVGYSFKSEVADDADTVDGQDAAAFAPVVHNHDPDYVNEGQADSITSAMIENGTIVDADINASANIAATKINPTGLDADLLDGKDSEDFVHTTGDNMTGTLNVNTTTQYALSGATSNTSGIAVYGNSSATSGTTFGVYGITNSTSGNGVRGVAPKYGVYGQAIASSGSNYAVMGRSNGALGYGVYGEAPYTGVKGYASKGYGTTYGVYGQSDSTNGWGVYGYASATSGTTFGLYGKSDSTSGHGVYGIAPNNGVLGLATATSGTTYGVNGRSNSTSGYGVHGSAPNFGIYGYATATSGTTHGVYGRSDSTSGYGVYGHAYASSGTNYGVHGRSDSTDGTGVYGYASASSGINYGVYGKSNSSSGYAIFGTGGAYAGYFNGSAHITGNLTVGGSKPCVQPIDNGKKVLLYAMESPEIWFEDFGTAKLVNGQAVVPIEKVFAQTANIEMGYLIFLTPVGECHGLYIARQDKDVFEVRELGGGTSNNSFYYRIVAKRRGYEEVRFEEFNESKESPAEPNLSIEKK